MSDVSTSTNGPMQSDRNAMRPRTKLRRPATSADVCWGTISSLRLTLAVALILAAGSKLVNPQPLANASRAGEVPEHLIQYESSSAVLRFQILADPVIAAKGGSDGSARPHFA